MHTIYDGLTIGEKHTYTDFGLYLQSFYIPEPEPKLQMIDIPYANGSIDLSEVGGGLNYANRDGLEFVFEVPVRLRRNFSALVQSLSMYIHGKLLQVIPDCDPNYYYKARLNVDGKKTNASTGIITLSGMSEPFKYSVLDSTEPWLWDPFNFETDYIHTINEVTVNGTTTVTLPKGGIPVVPVIRVTTAGSGLAITFGGSDHALSSAGDYYFPQIKAGGDTEVTLTFKGSGKVKIVYRSKYL